MRNIIIKYTLYFIILVLVQVLVLNNMQISSYLNPYAYVLFILILPFEIAGWLLLSIAFVLGLTMDIFPQGVIGEGATLGIHTSATVFIAFLRPLVLKWINPRDDYEPGTLPCTTDYGFRWYITYALILVSIHHFILFSLEAMSIAHFPDVIGRTILSILFSLTLILIWEGFRFKRR